MLKGLEDRECLPRSKLNCITVIAVVWSESSWVFPVSCAADESQFVCLSNGSLAQVHLGNANGFSAVFKKCKGLPPPAAPLLPPSATTKLTQLNDLLWNNNFIFTSMNLLEYVIYQFFSEMEALRSREYKLLEIVWYVNSLALFPHT